MNKVESFSLDGNLPKGMKSIGFHVKQVHIEEVGEGLKMIRDFDQCYVNEGVITHSNVGDASFDDGTPWIDTLEIKDPEFNLSCVELVFGEEIELPEGYEVYWISLQPEQDISVVFALTNSNSDFKWFIPQNEKLELQGC